MAESKTLTFTMDVAEFLGDFVPRIAKGFMDNSGAAEGLQGTEFTLTVEISGCEYSYVIKDGKEFDVREGGLDSPMVRMSIPIEDVQKMAQMKYIDFLVGMQDALSKQKYDVICRLKGTAVYNLRYEDGESTAITLVFNGGKAPRVAFTLTMENAQEVTSKRDNPVAMFMAGKLKIEGDMAFAMSTQALFT